MLEWSGRWCAVMKYYESNNYNKLYKETGNLSTLNGYGSSDYRKIPDYHKVYELVRELGGISSICDLGCGSGLLLKFLIEKLGSNIVPYGYDYNPVAIEELIKYVWKEYTDNFRCYDVNDLEDIRASLFIYMFTYDGKIFDTSRLIGEYFICRVRLGTEMEVFQTYLTENDIEVIDHRESDSHFWYLMSV